MGRPEKEDTWCHFKKIKKGKKIEATCKYCNHFWGSALVTRLTEHLTECAQYIEYCQEIENATDDVEEVQSNNEEEETESLPQGLNANSEKRKQAEADSPQPKCATSSLSSISNLSSKSHCSNATATSGGSVSHKSGPKKMQAYLDTMSKGLYLSFTIVFI